MTIRHTVQLPDGRWRIASFRVPFTMWVRIKTARIRGGS